MSDWTSLGDDPLQVAAAGDSQLATAVVDSQLAAAADTETAAASDSRLPGGVDSQLSAVLYERQLKCADSQAVTMEIHIDDLSLVKIKASLAADMTSQNFMECAGEQVIFGSEP